MKTLWEEGSALNAIRNDKWDYVVLQEQSTLGTVRMTDGTPQINDPKMFHKYVAGQFERG